MTPGEYFPGKIPGARIFPGEYSPGNIPWGILLGECSRCSRGIFQGEPSPDLILYSFPSSTVCHCGSADARQQGRPEINQGGRPTSSRFDEDIRIQTSTNKKKSSLQPTWKNRRPPTPGLYTPHLVTPTPGIYSRLYNPNPDFLNNSWTNPP